MIYNVVVCDDDPMHAAYHRTLVQQFFNDQVNVYICSQPCEVLQLLQQGIEIHILLMDIEFHIDSGIDAVDLLQQNRSDISVIYVTGHMEYCSDVYRTEHVGFLTKPVQYPQLKSAMERAILHLQRTQPRGVLLQFSGQVRFLPFRQIHYLESRGRKILYVTQQGTQEQYGQLSTVGPKLDTRFFVCHKSFVVNLDYVKAYEKKYFLLYSGERIPISLPYRQEAQKQYFHRMGQSLSP